MSIKVGDKARTPSAVQRAERAVVRAVRAQRKANSCGLSFNVLDAVKQLVAVERNVKK